MKRPPTLGYLNGITGEIVCINDYACIHPPERGWVPFHRLGAVPNVGTCDRCGWKLEDVLYPPGSVAAAARALGEIGDVLLERLRRSIPGQIRATDPELADRMEAADREAL